MIAAVPAMAQSTTAGAIVGSVTDQSGAVIPNAKVTVTSLATNTATDTTSNVGGDFRAPNLTPGRYSVSVTATNFSEYKASVIVEVGLATRLEVRLNVGAAKGETVQVVDEAPVVNTERQDFATNFNQAAIQNLPINGRRWSNYALLSPTGNPDGTFGLLSFRGISGILNNSTIDGGDNNNNFYGEERGRTRLSYSVSQDSVQEFQVNSSNFSAEYGRAAGAAVNTVTKSGTNAYHGSAYWYVRDNALGATNPSTVLNGAPFKPDDRRDQFGATLGGPIIKDRVFFFFNWDQQKRNFPGLAIPFSGFGAITVPAAAACPANNTTGLSQAQVFFCRYGGQAAGQAAANAGFAYLNNLLGVNPRSGDQLIFFPKVDVRVWGGNWSTSYNWLNWTSPSGIQTQPTNTIARDQFGSDLVRARSINSTFNKALTNTVAMELRFHWSTENLSGGFQESLPGQPVRNGVTGAHVPGVSISNWLNFGTQNYLPRPSNPLEDQFQYSANFTASKGKHTLKFGAELLREHDTVSSLFNAYGTFSFSGANSFADWVSDAYNTGTGDLLGSGVERCFTVTLATRPCYGSFSQGVGTLGYDFYTTDYSAFIQDDWKIHPRLNLNLGLRFEYEAFPDPQFANPILAQTTNRPSDKNNWGPRAGFAWDILGNGKMVLRGGYGLYYGRVVNSFIASALTSTGVPTAQPNYTVSNTQLVGGAHLRYPDILTTATGLTITPNVVFFANNLGNPMIHQSDVVFEYEVLKNTVISASYLNSMGRGLINFLDTNLPATYQATNTFNLPGGGSFTIPTYGTLARPNTSFNQITRVTNSVDSDYNAVVIQVNRRMYKGLQFQSSYTYSKATDNGQISTSFSTANNALDPANPKGEFGRSNFDVPHKFVFAGVWQPNYFTGSKNFAHYLLDDWTLAPIVSLSSGATFTGTISGNLPAGNCAVSHSTGINCANPGVNRPANLEKNEFRAPSRDTVDFRISRNFRLSEKLGFEFIAEAFNLFNHPNVSSMNTLQYTLGTCTGSTAANTLNCNLNDVASFNTPLTRDGGTNLRERQIQFGVRFKF
ncbi:MAG: TonB-dependent receptor [Acidobacteriales bacterium]|nr:TonB-dependent receptor [Terriglobales bacterium]